MRLIEIILADTIRIKIIDKIRDALYDRNRIVKLISDGQMVIEVNDKERFTNNNNEDEDKVTITRVEKELERSNSDKFNESNSDAIKVVDYRARIGFTNKDGVSYVIENNGDDDGNLAFTYNGKKNSFADKVMIQFGIVIQNIQSILFPIMECYWKLTSRCSENNENCVTERMSMPDRFRDHCIAIILSEYKGGKKDREVLIKGLKRQTTISEMYKYLVDQLWENAANEALIRQRIQLRIRINHTVSDYYNKLFSLIKDSSYLSNTQKEVYESIFDKASDLFIMESKHPKLS